MPSQIPAPTAAVPDAPPSPRTRKSHFEESNTGSHAWAKGGADLLEARRVTQRAHVVVGVGETYDFIWTPPLPGRYLLRAVTPFGEPLVEQVIVAR